MSTLRVAPYSLTNYASYICMSDLKDPFERADSVLPHDLGTTLNLNGQAMVVNFRVDNLCLIVHIKD
jgi:hypothetical protein